MNTSIKQENYQKYGIIEVFLSQLVISCRDYVYRLFVLHCMSLHFVFCYCNINASVVCEIKTYLLT